jgi:hypothetical protein
MDDEPAEGARDRGDEGLSAKILSRERIGYGVPILIGVAVGVSGKVTPQVATIVFAITALWTWAGVVRWDLKTTEPWGRRGVASLVAFISLGIALFFTIRWVDSPQPDLVQQLYDKMKPLVRLGPEKKASPAGILSPPPASPPELGRKSVFPNAVQLTATRWPDTFLPGSIVDGFQWRPYYSAVMLTVADGDEVPIEGVDLTIGTDQAIGDVGIEHGNGVEIVTTPILSHVITETGEDGRQISRQVKNHFIYASYQVTCRRLRPKNSFSLMLATAAMNASEYNQGKVPV